MADPVLRWLDRGAITTIFVLARVMKTESNFVEIASRRLPPRRRPASPPLSLGRSLVAASVPSVYRPFVQNEPEARYGFIFTTNNALSVSMAFLPT